MNSRITYQDVIELLDHAIEFVRTHRTQLPEGHVCTEEGKNCTLKCIDFTDELDLLGRFQELKEHLLAELLCLDFTQGGIRR